MCLCDSEFPKDTAFIFLEEVSDQLFDKFTASEIKKEKAYSKVFADILNPIIKDKMLYYKKNPETSDALKDLKKGVIEYRDNVIKANDILMERGERITLVVKKAESLKTESGVYYSSVSSYLIYVI